MAFYRTILVACAIASVTVFTSAAFAQCGGCGAVAVQPVVPVQPVVVQPVVEVQPVVVEPAVVPVVPVAPAPIGVSCWDTNGYCGGGCGAGCGGCGGGGCGGFGGVGGFGGLGGFGVGGGFGGGCGVGGCGGGCGGCSATFGYHPVAPSPLYVVNQGPEYSGPGLMVPFGTYSPATNVAAAGAYPYVGGGPGYGYGPRYPRPYYRSRYTYQGHYWGNPSRYYPNRWRG